MSLSDTRIAAYSDIHREFQTHDVMTDGRWPIAALNSDAWLPPHHLDVEAILFAGDIDTSPDRLRRLCLDLRRTQNPATDMIFILGNHEYYASDARIAPALYKKAVSDIDHVHVLNNEVFTLPSGTHIVATTLWTDFSNPTDAFVAQKHMSDYRKIYIGQQLLRPDDVHAFHLEAKTFIINALDEHDPQRTILMTHHTLSPQINDGRPDALIPAYCNRMEDVILTYQPALVISGHIHKSVDLRIGSSRYLTNPRGYWPDKLNRAFRDNFVVELSHEQDRTTVSVPCLGDTENEIGLLRRAEQILHQRGIRALQPLEGFSTLGSRTGTIVTRNADTAVVHVGGPHIIIVSEPSNDYAVGSTIVVTDGRVDDARTRRHIDKEAMHAGVERLISSHDGGDGIDHINVYSRGKTALGRMLSNFAHTPFTCADGAFASIEGYWYWLSVEPSHPRRDDLRSAHGAAAKHLGRRLRGDDWQSSEDFQRRICAAIDAKLAMHPTIAAALAESTLPLRHYYVANETIVQPKDGAWVIEHLERCRSRLRGERDPHPMRALGDCAVEAMETGERIATQRCGFAQLVVPAAGERFSGTVAAVVDDRVAVVMNGAGHYALYNTANVDDRESMRVGEHLTIVRDAQNMCMIQRSHVHQPQEITR